VTVDQSGRNSSNNQVGVVLLAGGKGTRLAPYTKVLPKPLMPIGEMPILEILLRQLHRDGLNEVTLAVGHLASLLRAFFSDGSKFGINLEYSLEDKPLGTIGPLTLIDRLKQFDTVLVANGDLLTQLSFSELIESHQKSGCLATIAAHKREERIDFGVLETEESGRLIGFKEKPTYEFKVSMGVYVFSTSLIDLIPKGEYFDFPDLIDLMLRTDKKVNVYTFDGYWEDLGRPDDYERAVADFSVERFIG